MPLITFRARNKSQLQARRSDKAWLCFVFAVPPSLCLSPGGEGLLGPQWQQINHRLCLPALKNEFRGSAFLVGASPREDVGFFKWKAMKNLQPHPFGQHWRRVKLLLPRELMEKGTSDLGAHYLSLIRPSNALTRWSYVCHKPVIMCKRRAHQHITTDKPNIKAISKLKLSLSSWNAP